MEVNLSSKSDVLIANLSATLGGISANVAHTLVVWQDLVAKERERDQACEKQIPPAKVALLKTLCNEKARVLYLRYAQMKSDPLLSQVPSIQKIVGTLIERLAGDYDDVLAEYLKQQS